MQIKFLDAVLLWGVAFAASAAAASFFVKKDFATAKAFFFAALSLLGIYAVCALAEKRKTKRLHELALKSKLVK